jgi:hypothetical protein
MNLGQHFKPLTEVMGPGSLHKKIHKNQFLANPISNDVIEKNQF